MHQTEAEAEQSAGWSGQERQPPAILDLFVWSAGTAASAAIVRLWAFPGLDPRVSETLGLTGSMLAGAALLGFFVAFKNLRARRGFGGYAGEVLWLLLAVQAVGDLILQLLLVGRGVDSLLIVAYSLEGLVLLVLALLAGIQLVQLRRWRLCLLLVALPFLAQFLFQSGVVLVLYYTASFVALNAVALAVGWDLLQGARYPWTHWAGVLLYAVTGMANLAWVLVAVPR